ncbi:hypothetical protein GCM10009808_26140 [Microbacterium sediminicola]|uniref:ABC transporter n=1 Tax=Microbacterium sediminicola TaxID=415210 RepID=A0ABN2IKM7_9MICO
MSDDKPIEDEQVETPAAPAEETVESAAIEPEAAPVEEAAAPAEPEPTPAPEPVAEAAPAPDAVGEPVAEEPPVDDVVGSARESLADAEAAGRAETVVVEESVAADAPVAETAAAAAVAAPIVTASEPGYAPQPIFVQAPEAPLPRGNRAAAGAIGLLAALSFAVLYLAAWLVIALVQGTVTVDSIGTGLLSVVTTWTLWVPVVVFFIAFWLLGAIINRGRWAGWVIFGLLVGVSSYGGHLLGVLFTAPFWQLTASQGADLVEAELFTPLAIASFIVGRELTIWFGAWVAARGKRMTELNVEARREYERTLEAGPQLHQY